MSKKSELTREQSDDINRLLLRNKAVLQEWTDYVNSVVSEYNEMLRVFCLVENRSGDVNIKNINPNSMKNFSSMEITYLTFLSKELSVVSKKYAAVKKAYEKATPEFLEKSILKKGLREYALDSITKVQKHFVNCVKEKRSIYAQIRKAFNVTDPKTMLHLTHYTLLNAEAAPVDRVIICYQRKSKAAKPTKKDLDRSRYLHDAIDRVKNHLLMIPYVFQDYLSDLNHELTKLLNFMFDSSEFKEDFSEQQYIYILAYHKIRYFTFKRKNPFNNLSEKDILFINELIDREKMTLWENVEHYGGSVIQGTIDKTNWYSKKPEDIQEMNNLINVVIYSRSGRFHVPVYQGSESFGKDNRIVDELKEMTPVTVYEFNTRRCLVTYSSLSCPDVQKSGYISSHDLIYYHKDHKRGCPFDAYTYIASQYDPYLYRVTTFFKMPFQEACDKYFRETVQRLQQHDSKNVTRVKTAIAWLRANGVSDPDYVQISNATKLDNYKDYLIPSKIREILEMMNSCFMIASLQDPVVSSSDKESKLLEEIVASGEPTPEDIYVTSSLSSELYEILERHLSKEALRVVLTKLDCTDYRSPANTEEAFSTREMVAFSAAARKLGMEDNQVKAIYNAAINHLKNVKELAEYKYFIHSRKDASGESGSSADSEPELKTNCGTLSRAAIYNNENIISAINDELIQVAVVSFPDELPEDNEFTTPVTSIN